MRLKIVLNQLVNLILINKPNGIFTRDKKANTGC